MHIKRTPWRAEGYKNVVVNDSEGNTLALFPAGDSELETAQENARLIASAPDMLAALRAAESFILSLPPAMSDIEAVPRAASLATVRTAIYKAVKP